jgi:hypothetical protein
MILTRFPRSGQFPVVEFSGRGVQTQGENLKLHVPVFLSTRYGKSSGRGYARARMISLRDEFGKV